MCFSTVITQFFRSSSTCGSDETGDILLFSNVNFFTFKKKKKNALSIMMNLSLHIGTRTLNRTVFKGTFTIQRLKIDILIS